MSDSAAPDCAVIGEALIDLVDAGGSPYTAHAGGSALNVAVGLGRLARPVAFYARLSTDPFGVLLRAHAKASGVDLEHAISADAPSTIATATLHDGVAEYRFRAVGTADFGWTDAELADIPASVRLVQTGSLVSWLPPGAASLDRRLASLRAAGEVIISYDPNVRPQLLADRAAAQAVVEATLRRAHLVKVSAEDLGWLYPHAPAERAAASWLDLGPTLVVLTDGGAGAVALRRSGPALHQPAVPTTVVDTIGAGDSFTAGLIDGLLRADIDTPAALAAACAVAQPTALGDALAHAAQCAAITCGRAGADPPWAAELD